MPKVQPYGANKVRSQLATNQRAQNIRAADTSIAPGLNALATGVAKYQVKADETAAEEALIEFEREKNKLFFDPETGYFNSQGRGAYEGAEGTNKAIVDLQNKYSESLSSPRARSAFKQSSDVHVTRAMADIDKHAFSGLQAYETATREARVENTLESAYNYWNNTKEAAIQNALGRATIIENAQEQGLGAEATNEMLENYESAFSKARIEAAMQHDLNAANKMFEKFGDRIEGPDKVKVEGALAKANFDAAALQTADKVLNSGADTLSGMMAQLDDMPSETVQEAELKSEVTRLVTNRFNMQKKLNDERKDELYQGFGKQVQDGNMTSSQIPAQAWAEMSIRQRQNIHKIERDLAKDAPRVTDQRLLQDLLSKSPKDMAKLDPLDYYSRLDNGDYTKVQNAINKAKQKKTDDPDYISVTTNATRLKNTMRTVFGREPNKLKGESLEQYNAISRAIQVQVELETEANGGKKLSPSQLDKLYNDFTRKVVIEKDYWRDATYELDDYDAQDLDLATQYLQQLGAPINSINLINFIRNNPDRFGE